MELTQNNLDTFSKLEFNTDSIHNHDYKSIIYKDKNYIYKIVDSRYFYPKQLERNIDFLLNNDIPNIGKVIDKIYYNNVLYGYVAEYVHDCITLRDAINQGISEQDAVSIIIDFHKALKYFHANDIVLGELCLDHYLVQNNHGYLIDLDYMIFPNDKTMLKPCYHIKKNINNKVITAPSKYTDIVKVLIASLSLLIKMDLESLISTKDRSINLQYIYEMIIPAINNEKLTEYFKQILNGEELYFDDFLITNNYYSNNQKK